MNKLNSNMKEYEKLILIGLVGVGVFLASSWPILTNFNQIAKTHDDTHPARLAELSYAVFEGQFPPRWAPHLGFGYGMPLFSFYAPLPYYIGILIIMAGFNFIQATNALYLIANAVSIILMFGLARNFMSRSSAILASGLFMMVPYRAVDLYVRGALGEIYGMVAIVGMMWAGFNLMKKISLKSLGWFSVSVACLLLSHVLMGMMGLLTILIILPALIVFKLKSFNPTAGTLNKIILKRLGLMVGGGILGLGMSAYFIIPAIGEKQYTSVDMLTAGGGNYQDHFVYFRQLWDMPFKYGGSLAGPNDDINFEVGKVQLILLGIYFLTELFEWRKKTFSHKILSLCLMTASIGSILLTTFKSELIWKWLGFFSYFQFPWRFLAITNIFLALIGGSLVEKVNRAKPLLIVIILLVAWKVDGSKFTANGYINNDSIRVKTSIDNIVNNISHTIPDYINPRLGKIILLEEKSRNILKKQYDWELSCEKNQDDCGRLISETKFNNFHQTATFEVMGDYKIAADVFDFPGWEWKINGKKTNHETKQDWPIMYITGSTNQPSQVTIDLSFKETWLRLICDVISLVSIALGFLMIMSQGKLQTLRIKDE